jgi:OOP family OmpA-OmpF porin
MQQFAQKIGLIAILIGLSASASAAINAFDSSVKFPLQEKEVMAFHTNFYANEGDLNNMVVGLRQDQVFALLGISESRSSIKTPHAWTYVFKFGSLGKNNLACQYQVQFDEHQLVSGSYFDRQECVDKLHPPLKVPSMEQPKPQSTELTAPETVPSVVDVTPASAS